MSASDAKSTGTRGVYARLYGLIARQARKAVVFRRGPSKRVLLLAWDLKSDTLVPGQWLKGRIYERRCDLSPDGDLLVYLAANFREPLRSWTAISRPPCLTALALWPNVGTWGGGGLFPDARTLLLNHRPVIAGTPESKFVFDPAPGFHLPPTFAVKPLGEHSGAGEDDPIQTLRFERDGWRTIAQGRKKFSERHFRYFDPPHVFEKASPTGKGFVLRVARHGLRERNGPWYDETAQVLGVSGGTLDLGAVDWADFDHNGDILYAKEGSLFRLRKRSAEPILIADLNGFRFEAVVPPARALAWPKSARPEPQSRRWKKGDSRKRKPVLHRGKNWD